MEFYDERLRKDHKKLLNQLAKEWIKQAIRITTDKKKIDETKINWDNFCFYETTNNQDKE